MLAYTLSLPITSTAIGTNMDGPEVLRRATPNTSALHISHGCFLMARHSKRMKKECQPSAETYTVLYYDTV
jgi:hypothetical protein